MATLKVRADRVEEAKKALAQMQQHVRRNEPGNVAYIFHQRRDDPTVFIAYEKYANDEALAQHRQNMASSPVNLRDLLDGAPQIVMLEEI
jgi:quinol monooxygenase YgiN